MGKGGMSDLAVRKGDVLHINPRDIHVKEGWNLRNMNDPGNDEAIDRTAKLIVANGVAKMPPLLCYWEDGKAWLEDGHLRLAGALRAIEVYGHPVPTVPVTNGPRDASETDRVLTQVVRNSGKPFTPIEQAAVFRRLVDLGMAADDIASKSGLSRVYVNQLLGLEAMPEPVKDMVTKGEVTATLAIQTMQAKKGDGALVAEVLGEAVTKAKAAGKKKATAKDVAPTAKKPNLKKELKTIFTADVIRFDDDGDVIRFTVSPDTWGRLESLLGLKSRGPGKKRRHDEELV